MADPRNEGNVVFVGNVPYDFTEEQLKEVFKEVGPVKNFKLQFDRETGKPKGFGFCEYYDNDTAASAVRNLQGYDVMGRELRVNFASQKDVREASNAGGGYAHAAGSPMINPGHTAPRPYQPRYASNAGPDTSMGPIPTGAGSNPAAASATAAAAQSATDAITTLLATMSPAALIELMSQMKLLASQQPDQTRSLLQKNPPLAYAMFQALLMMNVISPITITKILNRMEDAPVYSTDPGASASAAPVAAPMPGGSGAASMMPPRPPAGGPPPPMMPPIPPMLQGQSAQRPAMPRPPGAQPPQAPMMMPPTMPAGFSNPAMPPAGGFMAPPPTNMPNIPANIPEEVRQALMVPQSVIDQLAPVHKEQILRIRAMYGITS